MLFAGAGQGQGEAAHAGERNIYHPDGISEEAEGNKDEQGQAKNDDE